MLAFAATALIVIGLISLGYFLYLALYGIFVASRVKFFFLMLGLRIELLSGLFAW